MKRLNPCRLQGLGRQVYGYKTARGYEALKLTDLPRNFNGKFSYKTARGYEALKP